MKLLCGADVAVLCVWFVYDIGSYRSMIDRINILEFNISSLKKTRFPPDSSIEGCCFNSSNLSGLVAICKLSWIGSTFFEPNSFTKGFFKGFFKILTTVSVLFSGFWFKGFFKILTTVSVLFSGFWFTLLLINTSFSLLIVNWTLWGIKHTIFILKLANIKTHSTISNTLSLVKNFLRK